MTLWHRAPRSVYQVYDEESYLSGEGAAAGVGEPTGASGPAGAGRSAGDGRERMEAPSHGPHAVRLLTLGLLGLVTAIAATIIVVQALHHSQAAPAPVTSHRDRTRSAWTATSQPPMPKPTPASRVQPGSTTRTVTSESVASAPVVPVPPAYISAAVSSGGSGRSGASAISPLASPTGPSAGVADAASLPVGEPLSASESHTDGEFGFER
jgi:hypothetical protein